MLSNLNKDALRYGIYIGIILILWYFFLLISNWYISSAGNYIYLLTILAFAFANLLLYRKYKSLNKEPFGVKFKSALVLCFAATVLFFIASLIVHNAIFPDYMEHAIRLKRDMLIEQSVSNPKFVITDQDLETTEQFLRKKLSISGLFIFNFGLIAFQGLIISLVISFATKPFTN